LIDVSKLPDVVEAVNAILNAGNSVELKPEAKGLVVAEQIRLFKGKYEYDGVPGNEEG
jgi:hypothetical protein